VNSPNAIAARTASEPTERSTYPAISSIAPGTAINPVTALWSRITLMLELVRKCVLATLKPANISTRPKNRPLRWLHVTARLRVSPES
jgi:hypothetical protein